MELNGLLAKFRGPSDPHSASTPLPSFVLLHGYGSNEDDLFSFERFFPAQSAVFSLRAPLPLVQGGRAWFSIDFEKPRSEWSNHEEAEQSIDQLLGALEALPAAAGHALLPPILVGFSQGAILSLATVLQAPSKIRGVAAFSGYWNRDLTPVIPSAERVPPLWASHGEEDQVIPIAWPDTTYDELQKQSGILVDYHRFKWLGHGIDADAFNAFRQWLNSLSETI